MRKSIIKIIAVFAAVIMVMGAFSACSKKDDGQKNTDASTSASSVPDELEAAAVKDAEETKKIKEKDVIKAIDNIVKNIDKADNKKAAETLITNSAYLEALAVDKENYKANDVYNLSMKVKVYAKNAYSEVLPIDSGAMSVLKSEIDDLAKKVSENKDKLAEDFCKLVQGK